MEKLWKLRVEIQVEPGDLDLDPGHERGFMNVVTWADSAACAEQKLAEYLETFGWHLLAIEDSVPVRDGEVFGSELDEAIVRAKENRAAIILGTFHSYPSPKPC